MYITFGVIVLDMQAVNVDSTDVTIWYKLGLVALKLKNFPLAKHAFTQVNKIFFSICMFFKLLDFLDLFSYIFAKLYFQGLECSVNHWPCLDKAITVLYVLYNYEGM